MKKLLLIISLFVLAGISAFGQYSPKDTIITRATVYNGDTIPFIFLSEVRIWDFSNSLSAYERAKYARLIRNVKKVYPYAQIAGLKLTEYDLRMRGLSEREQKILMKKAEAELKEQFGGQLKKLTITQGKILVKLIDRQTGSTTFTVVKELRGNLVAYFWQTLGKLFGYNLKEGYDPNGKDKDLEKIVRLVESGSI